MSPMIATRATVTQKAWVEIVFSKNVSCRTPTTSWMATRANSGEAGPPAGAPSGCMDGSRDQPRHLFRAGILDRLLRHLATAPHDEDAVGDGEYVWHAVADQHDGDPLVAKSADQVQHFGYLADGD